MKRLLLLINILLFLFVPYTSVLGAGGTFGCEDVPSIQFINCGGLCCNVAPSKTNCSVPNYKPTPNLCYQFDGGVDPTACENAIFPCAKNLTAAPCLDASNPSDPDPCPTALGELKATPNGLVQFLLPYVIMLAGLAIVSSLIVLGYNLLTSQGNPEKLQAAKELIVSIFSGIMLILLSFVLLKTIGVNILGLPGFK